MALSVAFLAFLLVTMLAKGVGGLDMAFLTGSDSTEAERAGVWGALKGSFLTLLAGAILYLGATTAMGLLLSTFMRSQIAALFGTAVLTLLPAVSFSGLTDPVSSLGGIGRLIGEIYPTSHFLVIARGTFSKALHFTNLADSFIPLLIAPLILVGVSALLLQKQER